MVKLPGGAQETVGTGRFETFLRRLLSVKGIVAPTVESKLQAGIELLMPPWELAENGILSGWRGYQAYQAITAVAAQYGTLQLQNPAGSSVIAVVELIELYPAAGAYQVFAELVPGTLFAGATVTQRTRLDARGVDPLALTGACVVTQSTQVAVTAYQSRHLRCEAAGGAFAPIEWHGPYVITPGYALQLQSSVANSEIRPMVRWWERIAEPSELAAR